MFEGVQCSFCERYHFEVPQVIASPTNIYICNICVEDFHPEPPEDMLYQPKNNRRSYSFINNAKKQKDPTQNSPCSFCSRYHHSNEVDYLIANNVVDAVICNNCLQLSKQAFADESVQNIERLTNFLAYWQQELSAKTQTFNKHRQLYIFNIIEGWFDRMPDNGADFIPLLDTFSNLENISDRIEKRIDNMKLEIQQITKNKSTS